MRFEETVAKNTQLHGVCGEKGMNYLRKTPAC